VNVTNLETSIAGERALQQDVARAAGLQGEIAHQLLRGFFLMRVAERWRVDFCVDLSEALGR